MSPGKRASDLEARRDALREGPRIANLLRGSEPPNPDGLGLVRVRKPRNGGTRTLINHGVALPKSPMRIMSVRTSLMCFDFLKDGPHTWVTALEPETTAPGTWNLNPRLQAQANNKGTIRRDSCLKFVSAPPALSWRSAVQGFKSQLDRKRLRRDSRNREVSRHGELDNFPPS